MTMAVDDDSDARDVRMELSQTSVEMELADDALRNMGVEIELVEQVLTPTDEADPTPIPPSPSPSPQEPDISHQTDPVPDDTRHKNQAHPPDACLTNKRVVKTTKSRMPTKKLTREPKEKKATTTKKDVCSSKPLRKTNRHALFLRFVLPRFKKAGNLPGRDDIDGAKAKRTTKHDKVFQQDAADDQDGAEDDIPRQIVANNAIVTRALEMNIKDVHEVIVNQMNSNSDSTVLFRFDTRDYQWLTNAYCPSLDLVSSVLNDQCHLFQNSIWDCQGSAATKVETRRDQTTTLSPKEDSDAATCCSDSQVCAESVGKTKNRKLHPFRAGGKARGQKAAEKCTSRVPEKGGSISFGSTHSLRSGSSTTSKQSFNPFNISQRSSRVSSNKSSVSARSLPATTPEPTFFSRMFDDATNFILPPESLNPVYPGDRTGGRDDDEDELTEAMSVMSSEVDNVVGTIQSTAQDILSSDIEDVWLSRAVLQGIADSNKVSVEELIESVCDKLDDLDSTLFSLNEKEPPPRRWLPKVNMRGAG